ncbi:hypothetical protein TWF694_009307 [Orbilia ellipsospora]|uniref:Uncharacterized protein n=1 Tax=Orbilia ellipsospora TaxID=2528407 RepID=A0AAV9XG16_9PEZI
MQTSTLLTLFLTSLTSIASAAPAPAAASAAAPTSTTAIPRPTGVITESFDAPTQSKKRSSDDLFKRTDTRCYDSDTFNTNDYWALENSFWSHTDWLYLAATKGQSWSIGSVRVCAGNKYVFENTHIYVRNIGDAMAVVGGCCVASTCAGGISSIRGDSGLLVDVWTIPQWKTCHDTW